MKLAVCLAYLVVLPLLCVADDTSCRGPEESVEGSALLQQSKSQPTAKNRATVDQSPLHALAPAAPTAVPNAAPPASLAALPVNDAAPPASLALAKPAAPNAAPQALPAAAPIAPDPKAAPPAIFKAREGGSTAKNLIKVGEHPMLANTARLDDHGLNSVTGTSCHLEMETYLRKVVKSLNLEVCNEVDFLNMVPMYSNIQVGVKNFESLKRHILSAAAAAKCPMVALTGKCAAVTVGCPVPGPNSVLTSTAHRRRACSPKMERSKAGDACPLPEGAAWCQVRLKNLAPYWMAVYDWSAKSDWVSRNICEAGYWDSHDLAQFGNPGQMLDIGGNLGYFSIAMASAGWNVSTFEPMTPNLAMINATLCRNPHLKSKVNLIPFGLGTKDQECDMVAPSANLGDGHVQCDGDLASGFGDDPTRANFIGKYDVVKIGHFSIRRLDQVLLTQAISKVDFVKIDVEGYESQVLAGAPSFLTQYKPRLFKLEVWKNSFGFNGTHFLEQFAAAGYHFYSDSKCTVPDDTSRLVSVGLWEGFACSGN